MMDDGPIFETIEDALDALKIYAPAQKLTGDPLGKARAALKEAQRTLNAWDSELEQVEDLRDARDDIADNLRSLLELVDNKHDPLATFRGRTIRDRARFALDEVEKEQAKEEAESVPPPPAPTPRWKGGKK